MMVGLTETTVLWMKEYQTKPDVGLGEGTMQRWRYSHVQE